MSYDFWSFPTVAGEDPQATVQRLMEEEESEHESDAGDPDPKAEARKKALADAIIKQNPQMTPFALEYDQIAEMQEITVEEAKKRFRYIELNGPDGGNGIQITLEDDHATIAVPYWNQGAKADTVFKEIWGYLCVLHDAGGYVTYDPQLERLLDLDRDLGEAVKGYVRVVEQVKRPSSEAPRAKKPWWKFW
jgi:hypothetical protein